MRNAAAVALVNVSLRNEIGPSIIARAGVVLADKLESGEARKAASDFRSRRRFVTVGRFGSADCVGHHAPAPVRFLVQSLRSVRVQRRGHPAIMAGAAVDA
jgi:hypothetical protein